jgi:hypothetical protein
MSTLGLWFGGTIEIRLQCFMGTVEIIWFFIVFLVVFPSFRHFSLEAHFLLFSQIATWSMEEAAQ